MKMSELTLNASMSAVGVGGAPLPRFFSTTPQTVRIEAAMVVICIRQNLVGCRLRGLGTYLAKARRMTQSSANRGKS